MLNLISAIVAGAIIGGLARLVMPGRQNISLLMTIILGILGSAVGSWVLTSVLRVGDPGSFSLIGLITGVACAAGLITLYLNITRRRG
ncbi:hypothetical protein KEM60_02856 [Austwickia sp. TVS 96-490-7B]|uniref:GlsB/YeaQ/YmgE family stress response membrane protein n=1 Tax=Austwickia sp. TVS 96-490-7B TaxID=2830843 RepID=UPI001C59DFA1|nr:GlsB/YeaQ/YmgE family stress response membrane protein [Austwickia sp. TVS 96-490-7B]MBW3086627.1 hypothetical protein [Austwickia sp. TVS 96-490-7B]